MDMCIGLCFGSSVSHSIFVIFAGLFICMRMVSFTSTLFSLEFGRMTEFYDVDAEQNY